MRKSPRKRKSRKVNYTPPLERKVSLSPEAIETLENLIDRLPRAQMETLQIPEISEREERLLRYAAAGLTFFAVLWIIFAVYIILGG